MGRSVPRARAAAWAALALAACLGAAACGRSDARDAGGLERAADDDWVGPSLADFRMTASDGSQLALADLAGAPFVLGFIFTTCSGPCPLMSASMRGLQDDLADTSVRLISVSVDPETDTPEVLAAYAQALGADLQRWSFLHGAEQQVLDLAGSVMLAASRNPDADLGMQVAHSSRLLVVDGQGRVRGYYSGTTPEGRTQTAARARWLARP